MIDDEFFKRDKEYYDEYLKLKSFDKDELRIKYRELRRKALKLLNDDLHGSGHEGSIGGMDAYDDELWKYLEGDEKMLFNKYARILDFEMGFKPHQNHRSSDSDIHKESYKVKRFKDIIKESKSINEGLRFNSTYLRLPVGEYELKDVLKEVEELEAELKSWLKMGWQIVSTVGEDSEIIPMMK
jgi:hypothetical protein